MGASLMFIPMGSYVPAGVAVLWLSNSCWAIIQVGKRCMESYI
jgi:membrane protein insertase Oxa1/YidC/SpoIIIJ